MDAHPGHSEDAAAIDAVRVAAADRLTRDFGEGHWSAHTNEAAVLRDIKASRVLAIRDRGEIVGTLTLQTKKPWAIDLAYFTPCPKALYLINMAVTPGPSAIRLWPRAARRSAERWRGHFPPMRFASTPTTATPAPAVSIASADTPTSAASRIAACRCCPLS